MSRPRAAAFDFDGTITHRDTLLPFLRRTLGPRLGKAGVLGASALALGDGHPRDRAKAIALRGFEGMSVQEVSEAGAAYAAMLPERYRPETLAHIESHAAAGDALVLVTASLAVYARPAAEALGFDAVIAVELEAADGVLTGEMTAPNVRGDQKCVRLRHFLAHSWPGVAPELWTYGNSAGDAAMLAMADHPTWLGRGKSPLHL